MTFVDAGGKARWDMLVSQHNETFQVEECRTLSQRLGMESFTINTQHVLKMVSLMFLMNKDKQ